MRPADPSLLDPSAAVTGPRLIGALLVRGDVAVQITEVEAYEGADDPASHAWKGPTRRNEVMFGPAGHLYTYAMHGHTCCNIVCSPEGVANAVLIRAGRVISGIEEARTRRPGVPDERLARGPGCLTKALGITMADAGTDLFSEDSPVRLMLPDAGENDDDAPVVAGPRVGVPRAVDAPLRFFRAGDPTVSAYRKAAGVP